MKKVSVVIVCTFLLLVGVDSASAVDVNGYNVEIILDASGSMAGNVGGQSKMSIAKSSLGAVINSIPESVFVGLRAYGHTSGVDAKNCTDTQLLYPIGKVDKTSLTSKINSLSPMGWTPIDYSLRQAKNDFPATSEYGKMIILVSDGEETCGGDPCAAAKEMVSSGFDVVINTVGFDVDNKTEQQLKCIAAATGGEYKSARNASELTESLRIFSTRAFEGFKSSGGAKAGTGFVDAPLVTAGDYGGDILMGESKFYKFNAKKGQEVISVVSVRRESATTASIGCTCMQPGIKIFDKYKREVGGSVAEGCYGFSDPKGISGDDLSPSSYDVEFSVETGGEYYVSISGNWDSECTTTHPHWLDQLKTRTPKAFFELTIGIEGEGEEEVVATKSEIDNINIANNAIDIGSTGEEMGLVDYENSKTGNKNSLFIWIAAVIGAIVVLGMALVMVVLLKKKKANSSDNIAISNPSLDQSATVNPQIDQGGQNQAGSSPINQSGLLCPKCQKENLKGAKFCAFCQSPIVTQDVPPIDQSNA